MFVSIPNIKVLALRPAPLTTNLTSIAVAAIVSQHIPLVLGQRAGRLMRFMSISAKPRRA